MSTLEVVNVGNDFTEDDYIVDSDTVCPICYAEFLDAEDLLVHKKQMHSVSLSRYCQFCDATYADNIDYAIHLRDTHIASIKCCKLCHKLFTDISELRKHKNKHENGKHFACSQCSDVFVNVSDLESHEISEHNNNEDGISLHHCYNELSSVMNLKASVLLDSLEVQTIYLCVCCEFTAQDLNVYIDHLKRFECRSIVCCACCNVYKCKASMIRHVLTHPYCSYHFKKQFKKCSICHKFIKLWDLNDHMENCEVIKCNRCDFVVSTMNELSEHQLVQHKAAVEVRSCKYCRRECVGDSVLQKHIERTHKSEFHLYKYLCVYCNMPFKHPQKLFGHFFSKHKEIDPYTCKICNTTYKIRKRFTLHIKISHDSIGFVEFDENYNVFFTDKKSPKPFIPKCIIPENIYQEPPEDSTADNSLSANHEMNFVNMDSDFLEPSENEGNQTETEKSVGRAVKRKLITEKSSTGKKAKREVQSFVISEESSIDEPLAVVKKKQIKKKITLGREWPFLMKYSMNKKRKILKKNKQRFICKICKKYCFTYQNYNNHMSLHSKNKTKSCIKCSSVFRSKEKLEQHMQTEHSSSKLTDTLKSLLDKRKIGIFKDLTMSERFQRTMKKVESVTTEPAVITPVKDGIKNFLENFTPENDSTKKNILILNEVTITKVSGPVHKKQIIKMTKFKPAPLSTAGRLAMPVKFKQLAGMENVKATMKLVAGVTTLSAETYSDDNSEIIEKDNDEPDTIDQHYPEEVESIPEADNEVQLENTVETGTIHIPHKIVIPELPKGCSNISIAHLQSEAPYYKIIKVKDILKPQKPQSETTGEVKLPDGTKLVTVNPLAHLLREKDMEMVAETKNKYYKSKTTNFEEAVAKAMQKLVAPKPKKVHAKNNRNKSEKETVN